MATKTKAKPKQKHTTFNKGAQRKGERVKVGDKPRGSAWNTAMRTSAPSKADEKKAANYKKVKAATKKRATRNAVRKTKR